MHCMIIIREKEVLGSGAFGTVYRGVWFCRGVGSEQPVEEEEVAVKTLEGGASEEDRVKFLQEAAIMGQFDHPNIVRIQGVMVMEEEVRFPLNGLVCIVLVVRSVRLSWS